MASHSWPVLVLLASCIDITKAEPPPPPPSYCASLQPVLDRTVKGAHLATPLDCFEIPGIAEVGFYGTRERPTANELAYCFGSNAQASAKVHDESAPFNLGYEVTLDATLDASGGLDLSKYGKWWPKLIASGGANRSAKVKVAFKDVRWRRIKNLRNELVKCEARAEANACLKDLSKADAVYSDRALVGKLVVHVEVAGASSIGGDLSVGKLLSFKEAFKDPKTGVLDLESEGAVTFAGTTIEAAKEVPEGSSCLLTLYRDADGDGYGNPKSAELKAKEEPGWVADARDCYDSNVEAHPGQTKFFKLHRGDGSFDYDCDEGATKQNTTVEGGCKWTGPPLTSDCRAHEGWQGSAPECGVNKPWLDDCDCEGLLCSKGCSHPEYSTHDKPGDDRTQACR